MNRKDLDKLLQDKLNNFSSSYSDQVWQNLEKELDREKEKAGFFWNFRNNLSAFLLVSALACIAAYGYYQYSNSGYQLTKASKVNTLETNIKSAEINNSTLDKVENKETAKGNLSPISSLNEKSNKQTEKIAFNKFSKQKVNSSILTNNYNKSKNVIIDNNNTAIQNNNSDNNKLVTTYTNSNNSNNIAEVNTISSQRIMSVSSSKKKTKLFDHNIFDPKRNCPSFNTNVPDYYLEIFGSPDYTFRSITTKDAEYNDYKSARLNSETELLAYSIGIRGELAFRNGLSLKTGITYSNIREKFHHTIFGEKMTKQLIVKDTFYHPGGNTTTTDTIYYEVIGNRNITSGNVIKSLEIPFLLAYQFEFTRWTMQLNAGIGIQITNIQKGTILTPNLEPANYTVVDLDHYNLYKRQWGLSFYTGVQFGYKLNGQLQTFIEPYAKYYPNSITIDGFPLSQKMLTIGANFGLKYRL